MEPDMSLPAPTASATGRVTKPVQMLVRMREPLKTRLEEAARQKGVSATAEVVDRLERSFDEEERFGGREMLGIVNLVAGHFMHGGQMAARATGHPEWTPGDWMADPMCFRIAMQAVVDALQATAPKD
jgi:hypothetical protein